eukprot:gene16536-biopygen12214
MLGSKRIRTTSYHPCANWMVERFHCTLKAAFKAQTDALQATQPRSQTRPHHLPEALQQCTHVFVRHDVVQKPLQAPYDGPFKIISRQDKHFTLNVKGKPQTISLDRLKPAHLETDILLAPPPTSVTPPQPSQASDMSTTPPDTQKLEVQQRTTRSGLYVHFPSRYGFD